MRSPIHEMTREELEALDIEVLDKLAFGVNEGDIIVLDPEKIQIQYQGDLENPQALFDAQGDAWARAVDLSEPVDVSVDNDGNFNLEDGHHRWLAAKKTGQALAANVQIKGKPIERILEKRRLHPIQTKAVLDILEAHPAVDECVGISFPENIEDNVLLEAALKQQKGASWRWIWIQNAIIAGANPATLDDALLSQITVGPLHSMFSACLEREGNHTGPRSTTGGNILHVLAKADRTDVIKLALDDCNGSLVDTETITRMLKMEDHEGQMPLDLVWSRLDPIRQDTASDKRKLENAFHCSGAMMEFGIMPKEPVADRLLQSAQILKAKTYDKLEAWLGAEQEFRSLDLHTPQIKAPTSTTRKHRL